MSFKKRYFFKLITNFVGFGIGLITQAIVPRALGPASYGNFSFLTSFFWQIAGFLNFNSSTAFYTKLSQRQNDRGLVGFYFYLILLIGLVLFLVVMLASVLGIRQFIWPEQNIIFIAMGAIWAFLTFCTMILTDISDAYALTVKSESINIILKITGVCVILFLFWKKWFSFFNYFSYQLVFLILSSMLMIYMIRHNGFQALGFVRLSKAQAQSYFREFSVFCLPLVIFTAFATAGQIGDRWFLQKFSGSANQGYYSFAYNVGNICMLFTSALVPLVLREQSIHFGNLDFEKLKNNFSRSLSVLVATTAFICCFLAVKSSSIIKIFAGDAYAAAFVPMVLMCLYPIQQTYGQLNANFFFATGRVHTYRNIGIIFILIGLVLTFFLLGPKGLRGLNLGANGLSFKMMLLAAASVNVQLWFNAKYLGLSFKKLVLNQLATILIFITCAWAISGFIGFVFPGLGHIAHFIISGSVYTFVCGIILFLYPGAIAVTKDDVYQLRRFIHRGIEMALARYTNGR